MRMVLVPFSRTAPLMVGVVTADLGTAGGGEIAVGSAAKLGGKAVVQGGADLGIQNEFGCCHKKSSQMYSQKRCFRILQRYCITKPRKREGKMQDYFTI